VTVRVGDPIAVLRLTPADIAASGHITPPLHDPNRSWINPG
jgi:hypothetical protein